MRIPRARLIEDELSKTGLSKDRKYKLRNLREGKCISCGDARDYFKLMVPKDEKPYEKLCQLCKRCSEILNERRRKYVTMSAYKFNQLLIKETNKK